MKSGVPALLGALMLGTAPAADIPAFSHRIHVEEEELECAECHAPVMATERLYTGRVVEFSGCLDCHDDGRFSKPGDYSVDPGPFHIKRPSEKNTVEFSHKLHLERKIACMVCHGDFQNPMTVGQGLASMRECMECHQRRADNSCTVCHQERMQPRDHFASFWKKREGHGLEANMRPQDCTLCHAEKSDCDACHMGVDPREVHEPGYRLTHGVDVRLQASNCATCHAPVRSFCGDCHERLGVRDE